MDDIDGLFGSISFAYEPGEARCLTVVMHGHRELHLRFSGVIALRFENDCPGFDPLPHPLPMIQPGVVFPLLKISQSSWLNQWSPLHATCVHFALLSLDDLVQIIAEPNVDVRWG